MRTYLSFALIVGVSFCAATSLAQETVAATEAQQEYNNQGVIKMQQGKPAAAVASFRSSLSLGELNVTYLNLGRAYFRMDHCLDAREAYDAVSRAPKVDAPSPEEVATLLERFEQDYASECDATIQLSCEGDPEVGVAGAAPRPCSAAGEWPVKPGAVVVSYNYGDGALEQTVEVEAGASVEVSLSPPVEEEVVATAPPTEGSNLSTYGWIATGVGSAFLLSALGYDLFVTGPALDELEGLEENERGFAEAERLRGEINGHQRNTIILGAFGSAAIIGGIVTLFLADDDSPSVSLWTDGDRAAVTLKGAW